jgi:uncharacterized protein
VVVAGANGNPYFILHPYYHLAINFRRALLYKMKIYQSSTMSRLTTSLLAILLATNLVFAVVEIPAYQDFVTDTSGIISDTVETRLNAQLRSYETETGTELAILTIPLIPDGLSANEYATQVGNSWGVGKAKVDNGALLLIETDDVPGQRDIYIATGSQLEGGLTDIEATDIVESVIIPQFRAGDFDMGVTNGVTAMIASLAGESFTDLRMDSTSGNGDTFGNIFGFFYVFFFFVLPWFGAMFGRSRAIWPGGAVGALVGGFIGFIGDLGTGGLIGAALGIGLFGLGLDWLVSRNYENAKKSGDNPSWWAGGGSSGGSSGGGSSFGGGGFSGGGGGGSW